MASAYPFIFAPNVFPRRNGTRTLLGAVRYPLFLRGGSDRLSGVRSSIHLFRVLSKI